MTELNRTLDQELAALARRASLECPVCGEFVLHARGLIGCPECGSSLADGHEIGASQLEFMSQAG